MKHRMIAGVRPRFGGICLRMGLSLIAATFSARILGEWLAEVEMTDVFASLATVPASGWLPAILATGISFSAIAQYDVLFHGWLGTGVSPWRARFSGAASIAVAQTLGLGLATGTLARWRTLPELSLRDSLRVTNYISFSFIAALGALCAVALTMWGRGMPGTNLFAAVASCAILLTVVLSFVPFGYLPFRMPPLRLTIRLLALAAIDTGAAAIALWLLLPADIDVPATVFAGAFLLALSAGFLSGTPGGVGPFEICFIAMLPEVPEPQLLASILAFRIVYYALPAALAVLALAYPLHRQEAPRETWRTTPRLRRAEAGLARLQDHRLQALANTVVVAAPASQSLVSIGNPVCGSHLKPADLRALAELADTRGLWPALYKIGARSAATARHQGWKILATSDEAWFDPRTFSVEQPRYRQLRRKLRQAQAEGVRIESPNSLPLA